MVSASCCFWESKGLPESTHGEQLQWGCLCMSHLGCICCIVLHCKYPDKRILLPSCRSIEEVWGIPTCLC